MSMPSFPCPRCGRARLSPTDACGSCDRLLSDAHLAARTAPAHEGKRRISRRTVLLGFAGGVGAIAVGSGMWSWYTHMNTHMRRPQLLTYTGHEGAPITALAWSPDGDSIASGDVNGAMRVWDPATGATLLTCQTAAARSVASLSWAPDSPSILVGYANMLVIWDTRSGQPTFMTTRLTGPAAYSPLGNFKPCYLLYPLLLAACESQHSALVFPSTSLSAPLASLDSGSLHSLAFDPVMEQLHLALITASSPRQLAVYKAIIPSTCSQNGPANAALAYERWTTPDLPVSDVGELLTPWGPGGSYLIGRSLPRRVAIKGTWGTYEMDHPAEVVAAALCPAEQPLPADARPDGWYTVIGYIATADSEGAVRIWGNDQKYLTAMQTHQPVLQLAWSPDGAALAVVIADGTVQVWRADLSSLPALWRNTSFN